MKPWLEHIVILPANPTESALIAASNALRPEPMINKLSVLLDLEIPGRNVVEYGEAKNAWWVLALLEASGSIGVIWPVHSTAT